MELKSLDISQIETSAKSDEWRDGLVLDVRKTDVYVILFKGSSNLVSFQKSRDNGRTGQDLLQQTRIKVMLFHYMKESEFSGIMIRDRRGQQCSEGIGGLYN